MPRAIEALLAILDLEPLERNLFRGRSPEDSWARVFGGQVIAQALIAAARTVPDERRMHSLHAYFMLPGDPAVPIVFDVDRIRDGGSFTTRRVVAIQHGAAIFSMSASFQVDEPGLDHQAAPPAVPGPESLPAEAHSSEPDLALLPKPARRDWGNWPLEMRPVSPDYFLLSKRPRDPAQQIWFRATGPLPDGTPLHQAILAYASDMMLIGTALYPHGRTVLEPGMQVASLDHALWFHRPFRADDWLLYVQESPSASAGRGFARGAIYTRDGVLVASVAQEGLIRVRDPARTA